MEHTIDCTDCKRKPVRINQEDYDKLFNNGMSGWGYNARCRECSYKSDIWDKDKCLWSGMKFEVGKYHHFSKKPFHERLAGAGQSRNSVQHYIINVTKITKCFVNYDICDVSAGWDPEGPYKHWVACRKKIKFSGSESYPDSIEFPGAKDNWSKETYGNIEANTMYKIGAQQN